jgi:GNAT superfamily N-acetyltransferase
MVPGRGIGYGKRGNLTTRAEGAMATASIPAATHRRNIRYRTISPADWRRLQRFHRRLSEDTVELRFHGAKRELSTPLAHHFADVDGVDDVAIVATTGTRGRIVGVGRYSRMSPDCAEVAFVVEDAYQHHGIGRGLMRRLRDVALANGITRFVAEIMPGNTAMVHLIEDVGESHVRFADGVLEATVEL